MLFNDPATLNVIKVNSIRKFGTPIKNIGHYDMLIILFEKETKRCCDLTKFYGIYHSGPFIPENSKVVLRLVVVVVRCRRV